MNVALLFANLSQGDLEVTSYISEYDKLEARSTFDSTDPGIFFYQVTLVLSILTLFQFKNVHHGSK